METLVLRSNKCKLKIDCEIRSKSGEVIKENIKYFKKLKKIDLGSKNEDKIDNLIEDRGYMAIINNSKYLSNLEILDLHGKSIK